MHPLVMRTSARHRRTLTTPQLLRIAVSILLTVAVVAALGLFGGSLTMQTKVLDWFSARGVSPALVGWAAYLLPVLTFAKIISPRTRPIFRLLAYLVLPPAILATAVMSRPRTMTSADWKLSVPAEFADAVQLTAYALLAAAAIYVISCIITLSRSAATPTDDILIALRRNASRVIFLAAASTLATIILT